MKTCQRCYRIVDKPCQSDTETLDCKNLTRDAPSRFAICAVGSGFSVEDRQTGNRVSYHRSWAGATKAAAEASEKLKAQLDKTGWDCQGGGAAI